MEATIIIGQALADAINEESERQVIDHLGGHPEVWHYGGPSHNDDRLTARYDEDDDCVRVTDGGDTQALYDGLDAEAVADFVRDWHEIVWDARAEAADGDDE